MSQPTVTKGARTDNTADASYAAQPTYFTPFGAGDKVVPADTDLDTQAAGTRSKLKVPSSDESEFPYWHWDDGSAAMKRIYGVGTNNKGGQGGDVRYVYWVRFVGDTVGKVLLRLYDNSNMNSWKSKILGGDDTSPNQGNSKYWGVSTTNGLPGAADWIAGAQGNRLAGEDGSNAYASELSTGPVSDTTDLYYNLAIRIAAGMNPGTFSPYAAVVYSWQ